MPATTSSSSRAFGYNMASTSTYIPLQQREQWADIKPIEQDDGPNPLVPIMYSEEYRDAMDHFRAIAHSNEKSERALELTETIIRMNPSHYTIWGYRMETLLELQKDLKVELELMNEFARVNLKSYQVWHHRLLLLTHISPENPQFEIDYIHEALLPDPKNYHTWAYLHWLYSHFSSLGRISDQAWTRELEWCEELLRVDGRNNSAWGWRWFLRMARPGSMGSKDEGYDEIVYTLSQIHRIPHNISAWNYLRGLMKHLKLPLAPLLPSIAIYTKPPSLSQSTSSAESAAINKYPIRETPLSENTPTPLSYALELYAEILVEEGKAPEAVEVFEELRDEVDRMRAAYWDYRLRAIRTD